MTQHQALTPHSKVYVAGPMSGLPDLNFPAFDATAASLRAAGHEVVSPAELDRADGFDERGCTGRESLSSAQYQKFARNDLTALLGVDAIVLLPGWRQSTGATHEAAVAAWLGLAAFEAVEGAGVIPVELTDVWSGQKERADV